MGVDRAGSGEASLSEEETGNCGTGTEFRSVVLCR